MVKNIIAWFFISVFVGIVVAFVESTGTADLLIGNKDLFLTVGLGWAAFLVALHFVVLRR